MMSQKIEVKKIEDDKACELTFSKRCSHLLKRAKEIGIGCGANVAIVVFSPSARLNIYSSPRIEDVLHRYVNLSADERLKNTENAQEKLEKLKQIAHIKSDSNKLRFVDNQIENLDLQIKKKFIELQISEAALRDYEPSKGDEPASLHQLAWCEKNLQRSLDEVLARKNKLLLHYPNSSTLLQKQFDPHSIKIHDNILKFVDGAKCKLYNPGPSNIFSFPLVGSSTSDDLVPPTTYMQQQIGSSCGNYNFVRDTFSFPPSVTSMKGKGVAKLQSEGYQILETAFKYVGPKLSDFTNMQGEEMSQMIRIGDYNTNFSKSLNVSENGNNVIVEDNVIGTCNEDDNKKDESLAPYVVLPHMEVDEDGLFDRILTDQDRGGDEDYNMWFLKIQKEWEDLQWN